MKKLKLLLITTAFVIMLASVINMFNIIDGKKSFFGVYLELVAIGLLALGIVLIHFNKKEQN